MRRWVWTLGFLVACGGEPEMFGMPDEEVCLKNRLGGDYCIDVYEASREDADASSAGTDDDSAAVSLGGRVPWTGITWAAAKAACGRKNKRLCERDEWIDACDGAVGEADGTMFAYGDTIDKTRCNTKGAGVEAGGSNGNCKASTGTFDQSGNVWEWTGNILADASSRGGSFRSTETHTCLSPERPAVPEIASANGETSPEVGFRCCRDR